MKLKINGVVVVDGDAVTVSDVVDLAKVNAIYRFGKTLLEQYDDITLIEVERIVVEEEP